MKVTRKVQIETDDYRVGDQIKVTLKGFGKFTATAQKVTDDDVLFLFDDIIATHCMNKSYTNEGGYEASDLKIWLESEVLSAFPAKLKKQLVEISIPTYGQIFGHDNYYSKFEPDNDKQFADMKRSGNRVCDFNGNYEWWWLRNPIKKNVSSTYFAIVSSNGVAGCYFASLSRGVRPVFRVVRKITAPCGRI